MFRQEVLLLVGALAAVADRASNSCHSNGATELWQPINTALYTIVRDERGLSSEEQGGLMIDVQGCAASHNSSCGFSVWASQVPGGREPRKPRLCGMYTEVWRHFGRGWVHENLPSRLEILVMMISSSFY